MAQTAQQEPLKVKVTGGFTDVTADQKTYLKSCIARNTILDVELVSTTQGTSKVVAYYVSDNVTNIVVVNSAAAAVALVEVTL